jgi:hypothetical protein
MSAYIEVDHSKAKRAFAYAEQIFSLAEGSFSFDRRCDVFDALAGGERGKSFQTRTITPRLGCVSRNLIDR